MGLVEYIHPRLADLDYKNRNVKLSVILASFGIFAAIYALSAILASLTWTYRNLRTKEKVFWNLAVVRAVFGIFATIFGLHSIFVDTDLEKDPVFATTPTTYFALSTTVGFFLFECIAILISDIVFRSASWLLNIHHWLSLIGYSLVLTMESTHFFGAKGLILEMSTPFSALCWTLLKCGQAKALIWKMNQFLLVHTFHCRSVVECFLWYMTYKHWERIWEAMPMPVFLSLYVQLTLITFLMTPYWTYKKTAQMFNPVDWNFEDADSNKSINGEAKKRA